MASKSTPSGPNPLRAVEAPNKGGDDSQSVDGISRDPNSSGTSQPTVREKGKSSPPRGRGPSPSGSGKEKEGDNEVNRGVPTSLPNPSSSSNPFKQSDNILQAIADRFVEARKLQKAEAWRQMQVDLMYASPFICPAIIPYKDLIGIVSEIEKEIKGGTSQQGKSNEEIMADFLSGGGSLVITQMDIAPDLERDKINDIIEIDGGANGPVTDIPLSERPAPTPLSPPSDSPSS